MMKQRSFRENILGISLMYDAVLFIVLVSLAGVILLPVSPTPIALEGSVEKHREDVVDATLQMFLVSRVDLFEYRFCGGLIDDVAESIGINTSSEGLYSSFTAWLLAHEQRHKTYATLLAENLGCQFQLPFSLFGVDRLNIFTLDYDKQLRDEIQRFFSNLFGEKYCYNLTAWWHPIKGIPFGGEFFLGTHPPTKDCHVAHGCIMMPYTPVFSVQNHTILLTKQSMKSLLFWRDGVIENSSIPTIRNMTVVFENYKNSISPYDSKEYASRAMQENLSVLMYGFLIDGIRDDTNISVFPGIVSLSITYGFEKIRNITTQFFETALDESFGGAIRTIDRLFSNLNTSVQNPVSQAILSQLNSTLHGLLNTSFFSLHEAFDACESFIKEHVSLLVYSYLEEVLEVFVDSLFDENNITAGFSDMLIDFLFDRISINTAEVMLTIWVVRE